MCLPTFLTSITSCSTICIVSNTLLHNKDTLGSIGSLPSENEIDTKLQLYQYRYKQNSFISM